MPTDQIYQDAAEATGKTPSQLEAMARDVFGSMLRHALAERGRVVWTVASIGVDGTLDVKQPRREGLTLPSEEHP